VNPNPGATEAAAAVRPEEPREVHEVPKAKRITPVRRPTAEQRREGEARRKIAFILVWAYLAIITLDIVAPVAIVMMLGSGTGQIDAVRTISEEIAPLITAVVGVLGFVLGYYFKSEEKDKP
jgi:hypothetical protein